MAAAQAAQCRRWPGPSLASVLLSHSCCCAFTPQPCCCDFRASASCACAGSTPATTRRRACSTRRRSRRRVRGCMARPDRGWMVEVMGLMTESKSCPLCLPAPHLAASALPLSPPCASSVRPAAPTLIAPRRQWGRRGGGGGGGERQRDREGRGGGGGRDWGGRQAHLPHGCACSL